MNRSPSQPVLLFTSILMLLLSAACSAEVTISNTPTATRPIIITATLPPTQTPRPSPTPEPATPTVLVAPAEGQTISQLNVRSEPSADGNLLGTVEINTSVQILGKDPSNGWWMIVYPQSPTGMGWVTAQFVLVPDSSGVPVISGGAPTAGNNPVTEAVPGAEAGPTVGAGSAVPLSPAASSILATAFPDGDSAQYPAVSMTLSKASMRSFNYSSDISFPEGDPEDWVQFTLDGQFGAQKIVTVILDCSGSSPLNLELIQNSSTLQGWQEIACDQPSQLQLYLYAGSPYYLHLTPAQGSSSINYIAYTVIVQLAQ